MSDKKISQDQMEKRSGIEAVAGTIMFWGVLVLIFVFIVFRPSAKVVEQEETMEVILGTDAMLGNQQFGQDNNSDDIYGPQTELDEAAMPPKSQTTQASSDKKEDIITNDTKDAPAVKTNKNPKKDNVKTTDKVQTDTKTDNTQTTNNERQSNPNFEYQKGKSGNKGHGDDGIAGNKGKPNGSPDGKGMGDGTGKGEGFTWDLAGRKNISRELPVDNGNEDATIVLEIGVNRLGQVIEAKIKTKGSTVYSGPLVDKSKAAARKWKFSVKEDAEEIQYGTITFKYRVN